MKDVLSAILNNEYYDIVFKVVDLGKRRYRIIDGQYKVIAFKIARDLFGLERYNFILQVFPKAAARKIYINMNLGKPLTAKDHSKAWDDGTVPFFNELRDSLSHYPTRDTISFIEMLYTYHYAKSGAYHSKIRRAREILDEITPREINRMKMFLETAREVWGPDRINNPMYKMVIFRTIFRLFMEEGLDRRRLAKLMEQVKDDDTISIRASGRHKGAFTDMYRLVKKRLRK